MRKRIKIAYVDFWRRLDPEEFLFTRILRKYFDVEIDDKDPDFVFAVVLEETMLSMTSRGYSTRVSL